MKKRSILITAISLVLVAALSIGGTMAYFTTKSGPKNNVFTVGNISIALNEPKWDAPGGSDIATNMTPGAIANKNPSVKNTSTTNSCYVRLSIAGLIADDKGNLTAPTGYSIVGLNTEDWSIVKSGDNIYAYYNNRLPANNETNALFTGIKMDSDVVEGPEDPEQPEKKVAKNLTITLNAEAIQCQGDLAPTSTENDLAAAKRAFTNFPTAG